MAKNAKEIVVPGLVDLDANEQKAVNGGFWGLLGRGALAAGRWYFQPAKVVGRGVGGSSLFWAQEAQAPGLNDGGWSTGGWF